MSEKKPSRTMVFWVGLILFSLASVVLFEIVWMAAVVMQPPLQPDFLKGVVPLIVGGIVFMAIGIFMMRQGKREHHGI